MDLTKLSNDSILNVCAFLIEENLITETQFLQIAASRPSNELKRTVDYIHSALCILDHDGGDCNYYQEEQRAECWSLPGHQRWLEKANELMIELHLPSELALRQAFKEALAALSNVANLGKVEKQIFAKLYKQLSM